MTDTQMAGVSPVVQLGPIPDGDETPFQRYKAHLRSRYRDLLLHRQDDALHPAVRATRALVFAEALLAVVIGLSIDDLNVLRVPGFLVGIVAGLAILAFGGLFHGIAWSMRLRPLSDQARREALARRRSLGRVTLLVVVVASLGWLVVFSSGVPPWVA